jgi:hypothetical protein
MFSRFCVVSVVVLVLSGCGSKTHTVTTPPPPPPAAQITIAVNPTSVEPGQTATLSWSVANATACTASGDWTGNQALSGSENVSLSGSTGLTFTLACTGAGANATQTAKLGVAEGPNGCTVKPSVLRKTDRPLSRRRLKAHRTLSR